MLYNDIDFRNSSDTGEPESAAIQPITDGEPAGQGAFRRPTENVRTRSDTLRQVVRQHVILQDFQESLLQGGGTITFNRTVAGGGDGKFTITADLEIRPFATPGADASPYAASTKASLLVGSGDVIKFQSRAEQWHRLGSPYPDIAAEADMVSVEIVDTGTLSVSVTGASEQQNNVYVTIHYGVTTCQQVIDAVNANTSANKLVVASLASGSGSNPAPKFSTAEWSDGSARFLEGGAPGLLHTISATALTTFFATSAANCLAKGDTLAVWYADLVKLSGTGGRLQSTPENSSYQIPAGSLFNTRREPDKIPDCLPICKCVDNNTLVFIDGSRIIYGTPATLWWDSVHLINTGSSSVPIVTTGWTRLNVSPCAHVPPANVQEGLDNADDLFEYVLSGRQAFSGFTNCPGITAYGDSNKAGVFGVGGSAGGPGLEGHGHSGSTSGNGVEGSGTGTSGKGVYAQGSGTGPGVFGQGEPSGVGSAYGVMGRGINGAAGIRGDMATGTGNGVEGAGGTTSGTGVVGNGGGASSAGVYGIGGPPNGVGVTGTGGGGNSTGVEGHGKGIGYGVAGYTDNAVAGGVGLLGTGGTAGGTGVYGAGSGDYPGVRGVTFAVTGGGNAVVAEADAAGGAGTRSSLRVGPQASAPATALEGDVYADSSDHSLNFHDNVGWNRLAKSIDVQVFSSNGVWTKPANAKTVRIICVGAGGGGGSGRKGAAGTDRGGGGGGGGGAVALVDVPAATLAAAENVYVSSSGGAGGAAVSTSDTDGHDGSAGGSSWFGDTPVVMAGGGGGGAKGSATQSSGGGGGSPLAVGGGGSTAESFGGYPHATSDTDAVAIQGAGCQPGADGHCADWGGGAGGGSIFSATATRGGSSAWGAGGGGAGGSTSSANVDHNGGAGGRPLSYSHGGGGAGGGSPNAPGTAGKDANDPALKAAYAGAGGGGGAAQAGPGAIGGAPGGGGGGGAAGTNSVSSGAAGGAGARGEVRVITFF
jgi:hypothetical protein